MRLAIGADSTICLRVAFGSTAILLGFVLLLSYCVTVICGPVFMVLWSLTVVLRSAMAICRSGVVVLKLLRFVFANHGFQQCTRIR